MVQLVPVTVAETVLVGAVVVDADRPTVMLAPLSHVPETVVLAPAETGVVNVVMTTGVIGAATVTVVEDIAVATLGEVSSAHK